MNRVAFENSGHCIMTETMSLRSRWQKQALVWALVMTVSLGAWSKPAGASLHFQDGNSLLEMCREQSLWLQCLGYVQGVVDHWEDWRESQRLPPCLPGEAQGQQIVDAVVKYLVAHPQQLGWNGDLLVLSAILQTWCPQ
jgi:hypothetical protein